MKGFVRISELCVFQAVKPEKEMKIDKQMNK